MAPIMDTNRCTFVGVVVLLVNLTAMFYTIDMARRMQLAPVPSSGSAEVNGAGVSYMKDANNGVSIPYVYIHVDNLIICVTLFM